MHIFIPTACGTLTYTKQIKQESIFTRICESVINVPIEAFEVTSMLCE